jgi:purine-nucleoside phosphorylase
MNLYDQIQQAKQHIESRWRGQPRFGIILGTGLGGLAGEIDAEAVFPYEEIPHMPRSTAPGHKGQLVSSSRSHFPCA